MNQPLPLTEQLKNLEQIQELDLKIDGIKREQRSLPSVLKSLDQSLTKIRGSLSLKKNQLVEIEKSLRQSRAALDLNQDRLQRANSKLESVQNSQEFQAANKEIEQLKKLNASLEEQSKKTDSEIEAFQKDVAAIEADLQKIQAERDEQASSISGQDQKLKTNLDSLLGERGKFTHGVEARILSQYNRVRGARAGLGIVPALNGRCKGCNMMVPPQLYNEVQRGSTLHACPSCHRILYVPSSSPTTDQDNTSREKSS